MRGDFTRRGKGLESGAWPAWRNGRRSGLKIRSLQGFRGSSPPAGKASISVDNLTPLFMNYSMGLHPRFSTAAASTAK